MNITVGVTDGGWASFLRDRDAVVEANFWIPSSRDFTGRARRDVPFLFKTKSPAQQLVGGRVIAGFYELRVSEAWAAFGTGNGVDLCQRERCGDQLRLPAVVADHPAADALAWHFERRFIA